MTIQSAAQPISQAAATRLYARRFEHRIKTKLRCYTFGPNPGTWDHEPEARDALACAERREALGETGAVMSTLTTIAILCVMPEELKQAEVV